MHFGDSGSSNSSSSAFEMILKPYADEALKYGMQGPSISNFGQAVFASDVNDPEHGPTYFFHAQYDKLVIVPERWFSALKKARGFGGVRSPFSESISARDFTPAVEKRDNGEVVFAGDKPWFCYWNSTVIEAFIYTNISASAASNASSTSNSTLVPKVYPLVVEFQDWSSILEVTPYCQQMAIGSDGTAQQELNSTGQPIIVMLYSLPSSTTTAKVRRRLQGTINERQDTDGVDSCRCVWLNN